MQTRAPEPALVRGSRPGRALALALALFVVDRAVKLAAPAEAAGGWLWYQYSVNTAGPFSLKVPLLVLLPVALVAFVALVGLGVRAWNQGNRGLVFAAALMLAGGMSNTLDRLNLGGAVDVLQVMNLGSFNLADVYLGAGLVLMVLL